MRRNALGVILDTMQFETVFEARVPRASKRGPFIRMFEAFAPMIL